MRAVRATLLLVVLLAGCSGRCDCQKITMACGGANFTTWNDAADRYLAGRADVQLREENGTHVMALMYPTGYEFTDTAGIAGQRDAAAQMSRERFPPDLAAFENATGLVHAATPFFGSCAEAIV